MQSSTTDLPAPPHPEQAAGHTTPGGVIGLDDALVQLVAVGGWRVSDRLVDPSDPRHLLGFIEARGNRFEAMSIGVEFNWTIFDTMAEALNHLLTDGRTAATTRASDTMPWLTTSAKSSLDTVRL